MTYRERIKILKDLKDLPIWQQVSILTEKPEQVDESLNWAIKICDRYASKKEAKKNNG